jgi:hypothetical protein
VPPDPLGVFHGIPGALRGSISLSAAGFSDTDDVSALALAVIADIPLPRRSFFVARLPIGIVAAGGESGGVLGNAMLGARAVVRPTDGVWLGLGGSAGLPLLARDSYDGEYVVAPVPHALWDLHEFYPNIFPVRFDLDLEVHADVGLVFRLEVDPVTSFPFVGGEGVVLAIQHAAELQLGRDIGGGLRVQGVALPLLPESSDYVAFLDDDRYQLAFEPFFRLEREAYFVRTGVMLPVDEILGPPFVTSWGLRLATGMRL